MSPLSYVLTKSSYNFVEMISFFRFHTSPIFVDCPPSNGGALLLTRNTVVGSVGFGESFRVGKNVKVLILYVIAASIDLKSSVRFTILSSES